MPPNVDLFFRVQDEQKLLNELLANLRDAASALETPTYINVAQDRVRRALKLVQKRIEENAQ